MHRLAGSIILALLLVGPANAGCPRGMVCRDDGGTQRREQQRKEEAEIRRLNDELDRLRHPRSWAYIPDHCKHHKYYDGAEAYWSCEANCALIMRNSYGFDPQPCRDKIKALREAP